MSQPTETPTPSNQSPTNDDGKGAAQTNGAKEAEEIATPKEADQPCTDCLPRSFKDDKPFTECGCDACDTKSIEIRCQAEGIKARAEYADKHKDAPSPERYEQARLAYAQSRYKVMPILDEIDGKLADAMHEIRCRIDDRDKVDCLERSWKKVGRRLRKCRVRGCCVEGEYDLQVELDDCGVDHLRAQFARFDYVTSQADACFNRLALEPKLLDERVTSAQAEVDDIHLALHPDKAPPPQPAQPENAPRNSAGTAQPAPAAAGTPPAKEAKDLAAATPGAPAADAGPTDYVQLYAKGLVAQWHLRDIWWGFRDIDSFVECICLAMHVSMAGHRDLGQLYGELRVREARWEERNNCCKRLKNHSHAEIIEGYVRCMRRESDEDVDLADEEEQELEQEHEDESRDYDRNDDEEDEEEEEEEEEEERVPATRSRQRHDDRDDREAGRNRTQPRSQERRSNSATSRRDRRSRY